MRTSPRLLASSIVFASLNVSTLALAQQPEPAPAEQPAPPATPQRAATLPAAATPAPAATDAPAESKQEPRDETRSVYIGFSPLHLIAPVFEATAELKVHRNVGVSVIGGYGSIRVSDTDLSGRTTSTRFSVWEVGGQAVGYVFGDFDHGMQLGVELLYVGVSGDNGGTGSAKITGTGNGLGFGPLVGYKLATRAGFTFNVQGGVQWVALRARAENTVGDAATAEDSNFIPLLNANIGWSF